MWFLYVSIIYTPARDLYVGKVPCWQTYVWAFLLLAPWLHQAGGEAMGFHGLSGPTISHKSWGENPLFLKKVFLKVLILWYSIWIIWALQVSLLAWLNLLSSVRWTFRLSHKSLRNRISVLMPFRKPTRILLQHPGRGFWQWRPRFLVGTQCTMPYLNMDGLEVSHEIREFCGSKASRMSSVVRYPRSCPSSAWSVPISCGLVDPSAWAWNARRVRFLQRHIVVVGVESANKNTLCGAHCWE